MVSYIIPNYGSLKRDNTLSSKWGVALNSAGVNG